MAMELACEKCGRTLSISREQTGQQIKCPHCNNDIYIPTPEDEIEELPLAPEEPEEVLRERRLQDERRRIDRILADDDDSGPDSDSTSAASGGPQSRPRAGTGRTSVRGVVMTYLGAMRDTDLGQAEQALKLLSTRRDDALRIVDELAADQIPPAEMASVPPAVYQGFLKTLRSQL